LGALLREIWSVRLATSDRPFVNAALAIGRLIVAVPLLPNGLRKLQDFSLVAAAMGGVPQVINGRPFPDQTPLFAFPAPELFLGVSVAFDLVGALLLMVGLRTRAVALALAGYVLVAMAIFHSEIRGPADVQAILRNIPLLAALLMLAGVGAGYWSIDGRWARRVHRRGDEAASGVSTA
jgi:putative oxidoreductase